MASSGLPEFDSTFYVFRTNIHIMIYFDVIRNDEKWAPIDSTGKNNIERDLV